MRQERGDAADRARPTFQVVEREIALGGGVVLEDARNPKARLEDLPDLGAQPVAAREAQRVRDMGRLRRRVDEVAAELTDVLKQRAALVAHVPPKIRGREPWANHHGAAASEYRAYRNHAADAVVER